jgi:formylglycine-generating enzyme required for sulfatase activity
MAGNVWQWCADGYDANFWSGRAAETVDPVNRSAGEQGMRVLRGGSWLDIDADLFRASFRSRFYPDDRYFSRGFRCAAGQ